MGKFIYLFLYIYIYIYQDYITNMDGQDQGGIDMTTNRQIKIVNTQIDQRVYDLYGLTEEEIGIVEGTIK